MKKYKKLGAGLLLCAAFFLPSCSKWIDVAPKTQIESSRFLSTQQGYEEALAGVYLTMTGTNIYGRELTFGLLDVLGSSYSTNGATVNRTAFSGNYQDQGVLAVITRIFGDTYTAIANLNDVLNQIDRVDPAIFSHGNYNIYKGEALGLRAFLHFDLLRMYTRSYADAGENTPGIPYVTAYGGQVTPRLTVKDAMEKIISDLSAAEVLLQDELLVTGSTDHGNGAAFNNRKSRFNYYAVKATKARAYLWSEDYPNALKEAEDIIAIAPSKFPFVTLAAVTAAESQRDKVFTTEHLFGIVSDHLADNYAAILDNTINSTWLQFNNSNRITQQYEGITTDIRYQYLIKTAGSQFLYSKLHQPQLSKRMPLIKIPEMYYIAAECLRSTDPGKAIEYLNTVRRSRGLSADLSVNTSPEQILTEITKRVPEGNAQ